MSHRRRRFGPFVAGPLVAGVGAAFSLAGCGTSPADSRATQLRPVETSVPQGTADPRVRPAVEAYESFTRAAVEAQEHPVAPGAKIPDEADLARFSFDPIRGEYEAFVAELSQSRIAYRGTPPQSHIGVIEIDPDAVPWPRVVLSDCRSGEHDWQAYSGDDVVRPTATAGVAAPRGLAVTVVYSEQRWGVQSVLADPHGTCAPS
jgi:hypothetical protein